MINKLDDILSEVKGNKKVVLSVSAAHDKEVLLSIKEAVQREIVTPILIGDKNKIEQISAIEKEIFPHFSILKNFISFTPI